MSALVPVVGNRIHRPLHPLADAEVIRRAGESNSERVLRCLRAFGQPVRKSMLQRATQLGAAEFTVALQALAVARKVRDRRRAGERCQWWEVMSCA